KYKDYKIIGMPPPSSGGVALIQLLQGAAQLDLGSHPHLSAKAVHLMAELERRVFADRSRYLGDPDFYEVPVQQLISNDYTRDRFEEISLSKATSSEKVDAGEILVSESMETTHFSIVDPMGNAVAIT